MWIQHTDHEWIESVCRQLSRVTGWPITYAPLEATAADRTTDYAWACELNSSEGCIGSLTLALPPERPLDDSFLRACELVDLTAGLIQRAFSKPSHRGALPRSGRGDQSADQAADAWTQAANHVLDVGLRLTSFRAAVLFVVDQQVGRLRLRAQLTTDRQTVMLFGRPLDEAPFDIAALRNEAVVIRRRQQQFSEWLPEGMSLGVCRGITTSLGLQGTLWMFDRRDRRLTAREDVILDTISARLADLIEQAIQIEEGALQRRLQAELRIAAESQPEQKLQLQGVGGWCQIAGRTESAREVGGDLCEVLPLGDERILLAVGDAAGHSIPAAMVMSTVRGALRVIVDPHAGGETAPERIVARLNSVLHGIVEAHQFMTLTCAVIDGSSSTMTLCNAGHPPALLFREGAVERIDAHGLLLGVVSDAVYHSTSVELQPGDVLVFYSDGISEARARDHDLFLADGIAAAISEHLHQSADEAVEHVWTALQDHIGAGSPDDRTLLVVRFDGSRLHPLDSRQAVASLSAVNSESGALLPSIEPRDVSCR